MKRRELEICVCCPEQTSKHTIQETDHNQCSKMNYEWTVQVSDLFLGSIQVGTDQNNTAKTLKIKLTLKHKTGLGHELQTER